VRRLLGLLLRILLALGMLLLVIWNGLVDESFIRDDPVARLWLLVGTGLLVFAEATASAVRAFRTRGADQRRAAIRIAILPVLRDVARSRHIDITMLGASVFVVRLGRLVRVDRYRMSDLPQESRVTWKAGKGAIGQAWRTSSITHQDWRPIHERWGGQPITPEIWARIPPDDRSGFERDEFQNIVDKYAEVLAVPMLRPGGRCVGVVALDVPIRAQTTEIVLADDGTLEKAVEATTVIQERLGR
jgi:hypothetical protein